MAENIQSDLDAPDDVSYESPESESPEVDSSPEDTDSGEQLESPDSVAEVNHYAPFRALPQFAGQDDAQSAFSLYETMQREQAATNALQQYQQIIPFASEYLSNKEQYDQWVAQRNQPQQQMQQPMQQQMQAQAPKPESWWNPPAVREAYKQYLTRDENGREVIAENAPLDARHALSEMQAYKADFARKFLENPEQTLGPMVERVASSRAAAMVQQQFEQAENERFVAGLQEDNKEWLLDSQGNVSREGLLCQKFIDDAKNMGIVSPQNRWEYAKSQVTRTLLEANFRNSQQPPSPAPAQPVQQQAQQPVAPQPTQASQQAQKNMDYLRAQAARTAPRNSQATTDPRVPKKPLSFADKLNQQFAAEGLTE